MARNGRPDDAKIQAVRDAFHLGAWCFRRSNSTRGWSPTAQRQLERDLRKILRAVLGRVPTDEEIAAAGGKE